MTHPATRLRRATAVVSAAALGLLGTVALATPASATEFFDVDTETELSSAISSAVDGDVIHLTGAGFTLGADLPQIDANLTITGPGSASFAINGGGHEVFDVVGTAGSPLTVRISGVHVTNASLTVRSADADLTLDDVSLDSTGLDFKDGDLTVTDSDFSSTTASGARVSVADDETVRIEESAFDTNAGTGLSLSAWGSSTATLNDLSSTGSLLGFDLYLGNDAELTADGLTATTSPSGSAGIYLNTRIRSAATLTDTTTTGNGDEGIRAEIEDESSATFNTVTVTGNQNSGMEVSADYAGSVTINDAVSSSNHEHGFEVSADGENHGAKISLNRIVATDNDEAGLDVRLASGGTVAVADSQLRRNSPGLLLEDGSYEGTLTVDRTTIDHNELIGGGGVNIAAPEETDITISDSTIAGNRSLGSAGVSAHLDEESSLTIVNSTVSGNVADSDIAAIGVDITPNSGASFTLAHSTVTENESSSGGAVEVQGGGATIHDSIVAGNSTGTGVDVSFENTAGTIDYSLIGTLGPAAQTAAEAGSGNILGQPAELGPLADNGGPTLTHLPLGTSLALEHGDPDIVDPPATDQRGEARIVGTIDIGAVEAPAADAPSLATTGADAGGLLLPGLLALTIGLLLLAGAAWHKSEQYR